MAHDTSSTLQSVLRSQYGALDSAFLSRSISTLNAPPAVKISESTSIRDAILTLKSNKIGCLVITDHTGKLTGIFSERDVVLKICESNIDTAKTPITSVMTRDPIAEPPDTTIAFALNLMSQGGFRHIPIIDNERCPIAVLSVKNIVDHLVEAMTNELVCFLPATER